VIFEPEEKYIFLDKSSTNTDTLVPSLYQCVETRSKEASLSTVVSATSAPPCQPLRHQQNLCQSVVNRFTRQKPPTVNSKQFFMNILCTESFVRRKRHATERCSSVLYSQSRVAILITETSL
jgi:hypothetical protein